MADSIAAQLKRSEILRWLVPYFGKVVAASFLKKTYEVNPAIERLHNLIEGIYKPAWSVYPLTVASMLRSRYGDEVHYNADRTWWIEYSPKVGGMEVAVNAGLIRCMADRQPVIVIRQTDDKLSASGSRYRLLGLGFIENFSETTNLFQIRGLEWAEVSTLLGLGLPDELLETALRLESLEKWAPFVAEDRPIYHVSRQKRDAAFSGIVLENYEHACAVTGQKFHSARNTEAEGAHIIGKDRFGTDDPRNGIALGQSVHWAFDRGIFTVSEDYKIVINPKARAASSSRFPLLELDGQPIRLPKDSYYWPHREALSWHREKVFANFEL